MARTAFISNLLLISFWAAGGIPSSKSFWNLQKVVTSLGKGQHNKFTHTNPLPISPPYPWTIYHTAVLVSSMSQLPILVLAAVWGYTGHSRYGAGLH